MPSPDDELVRVLLDVKTAEGQAGDIVTVTRKRARKIGRFGTILDDLGLPDEAEPVAAADAADADEAQVDTITEPDGEDGDSGAGLYDSWEPV